MATNDIGSTRIWLSEPTGCAAVYTGWLTDLKRTKVRPHIEEIDHIPCSWLTLDEISEQLRPAHSITVIVDTPLEGIIYHYGNHGGFWEQVGKTTGYA